MAAAATSTNRTVPSDASADAARAQASSRIGASLKGKYRLERVLGTGGMGTVYAATQRIGGHFAVKVTHACDANALASVLREATLANRVEHPRAVRALDVDVTEDGHAFLVMPLLEGETLAARQERHGALDHGEVIAWIDALLSILACAHARGVVHRDVKPENLFLTNDGLTLLDFGIARAMGTPDSEEANEGKAVGTPMFMAPEQTRADAAKIDARTDLWAVGATMFTLLSGQFVHEGRTAREVAERASRRPARALGGVAPGVPLALQALVDRALAFDPRARWQSATEMQRALRDIAALDRITPRTNLATTYPAGTARHAPRDALTRTTTITFQPARSGALRTRAIATAAAALILVSASHRWRYIESMRSFVSRGDAAGALTPIRT